MVRYRILERRTNGSWAPFGVAYERDGRIVLFAPPWRADRTVAAGSLEDLDAQHTPSSECRWRTVESSLGPLPHPIDLLRRAVKALSKPSPVPASRPLRILSVRTLLESASQTKGRAALTGAVQA